jgi:hypothetical protein
MKLDSQSSEAQESVRFDESKIVTGSLYENTSFGNTVDNESVLNLETESQTTLETKLNNNNADTKVQTFGVPGGTQFTCTFAEGTPQNVINAVQEAVEIWSSVLKDDVNLKINFSFEALEEGTGADASPYVGNVEYNKLRGQLAKDATSQHDQTAIANLPNSDSINILINNTKENNGSEIPYLDNNQSNNNSEIRLSSATFKALGVELGKEVSDGTIRINSNAPWDYDRSDGISENSTDIVGVIAHEIGHILGFSSSADFLDIIATPTTEGVDRDISISQEEYNLTTLDLFRYSPESLAQGARDFTTGNIDQKYFSIDGGQTEIAPLSTGAYLGDGGQLSHWKETDQSFGLLDPTGMPGEEIDLSVNDLIAFDVIGWDFV